MTSWWHTLVARLDLQAHGSEGERLARAIELALRTCGPARALEQTRRLLVQRVVHRAAGAFEPNPLAVFIVDLSQGLVAATGEAAQRLQTSTAPGAAQASRRLALLASDLSGETFVQHLINLCLATTGVYTEATPVQRVDAAALVDPLVGLLGRVPSWSREWSDPKATALGGPERTLRPAAV